MREPNETQGYTVIEHTLPIYSDVQLEFWGDFYVENNLRARGILFETFLCAPHEVAEAVFFGQPALLPLPEGEEFYPLLPPQGRAAERIGICETCGLVDHHLAPPHFLCHACADKYGALPVTVTQRVDALKKAIEDGTYKGDDARVAHKLIDLWMGVRCD